MRKSPWIPAGAALAALLAGIALFPQNRGRAPAADAPAGASFRILLGVGDKTATTWDGSVAVAPGRVAAIRGWRFTGDDSAAGASWKASSRAALGRKAKAGAVVPNGVVITVAGESTGTRFEVKTAQGNFAFTAREIGYGEQTPFLNGRVLVDRSPDMTQLTRTLDDQDFPAVAASGDNVYVAYVEFTHANRAYERRRAFDTAPENFDFLAAPAGGDQVMLLRYSKTSRTWSAPVPVSAAKQDVMRTAIAVDGQKRVWVLWSANRNGNFDIYGRSLAGDRWSAETRLTTDAGTDVNPVAVTDAAGRVWTAWQGFRNGNLEVLASVQSGAGFAPEQVVSFSKASDWDPAIAASPNGDVAVSWDTYDKGDYDVYFRRLRFDNGIRMDAPVAVAASQNFEARSTAAFDRQGRLWVAFEASDTKWGKDFGAYETTGVGLYQDHTLRIRCFNGAQALEPAEPLRDRLPGNQVGAAVWFQRGAVPPARPLPDPTLAADPGNASPHPAPMPLNSFPRLAADANGAIYLAFRTPVPGQSPMGTVWSESLVYFDGNQWKGPVAIPDTDHWLDSRAAMAMVAPGDLILIATTDHRQAGVRGGGGQGGRKNNKKKQQQKVGGTPEEQGAEAMAGDFNVDLMAAEFRIGDTVRQPSLKAAPAERVAPPDPAAIAERAQVATMRRYRATAGGGTVQLMRGEFHRHTEMSGDGGRDGALIDAYRYLIDAASMDWGGCCDHDNGGGREYSWWLQQKLTDAYKLGTNYVPMFSYERSVRYPEGHRNVVFPKRGIRPLARLPKMADDSPPTPAPDTRMLYRYLKQFSGIVASHTSGTGMGTDWRDNDPQVEPVVEIYQGDRQNYEMPGAPRSLTVAPTHLGFVSLALKKGYRLGFQASSDHISTHMSYCNLWVTAPTREAIMEAFHKRRIYGATDNILADVRSGSHFMGEEFETSEPPSLSVKLWGTAPFAKVHIIKDGQYVYAVEPKQKDVSFVWKDNAAARGQTSFYYVRGEQQDGELVWVSPMWITWR